MTKSALNFVWCDLEFTHTQSEKADLMQAAMLITSTDLHPISPPDGAPFPRLDVALSANEVENASDWVKKNQSEQLETCLGKHALAKKDVENELLRYVLGSCEVPTRSANPEDRDRLKKSNPILAGNSTHMDLRIIQRHLPGLAEVLSYRLIDVTTIKELVRRWQPELNFDKRSMVPDYLPEGITLSGEKHDALYDVMCSIAELNYYRKKVLALGA